MIKQILALLDRNKVTVIICPLSQKNRLWGLCDYEDKELFIHIRLCERNKVRALIHECVHFLYKSFSEATVLRIEDDVYKNLTASEYERLCAYIKTT